MFGKLLMLRLPVLAQFTLVQHRLLHPSFPGCYVMIIYGTNGTHLRTDALPSPACPACGTGNALRTSLLSRYAHVYWIPLFPYQKIAVVQCGACGWDTTTPPAGLAPAMHELKKQTRHPYWTWSGLGLVALLIGGSTLYGIRDTHTDETLLESPRSGDVYTVRSDSANTHAYSLLKVRRVSGNSVELLANKFQTGDSTPFPDLDKGSCYNPEPFIITRLDLQIMRRKGELTDVDRP